MSNKKSSKTNEHYYRDMSFTGEPYETEITMKVSDIKTITNEDLREEKPKEEYDKLLLKVYWYLQGLTDLGDKLHLGAEQLLEEIEDFI